MSVRDVAMGTLVDGRYRIKTRIGSGGMADVYCATDEQLGRDVALKLLHRRFAEDEEFVERFRREASSAASLQHPHVVGVFDRGEWDGTSYIAMEHLEGHTLKQIILDEAPLDPVRAIDLAVQILRAARFAHRRGVIHRDLKPHNVIVDGEDRAKVTDFGIARAGASDMTQTGSIMGTAQYLSPEQAQGHAVDERSDLYSIGVVLYEMLTARIPFDGESAVTIALKQVSEPPVPPRRLNPAIPPPLEAIVLQAMEKDPARRFADADEFIAALERVRAQLTAGAIPMGQPTAAFNALPPAAPVVADVYAASMPPEPLPPDDDRHGHRWWAWLLLAILVIAGLGLAAYAITRPDKALVPDVVGRQVSAAQDAISNQGFRVHVSRAHSPRVPVDHVISQNPPGGAKLEKGSVVTLVSSTGPATKAVPPVEGQGRHEAEKLLTDAGFKVKQRTESSDSVGKDHVISVSPSPGTLAEIGSTVQLVVSSGPAQVSVPRVVGATLDSATATLQGAGLSVTSTQKASDQPTGTVLSQSVAPDSKVAKGTVVALVVAKQADVKVPNVIGMDEGAAVNAIVAAGLTPQTVTADVQKLGQNGKVVKQKPGGGRAKKGSTVVLTVGRFNPQLNPDPGATTTPTNPSTTTTPTTTTTTPASGGTGSG